ncbi:MAG: DnaJ domain-containing protein [Gammaproteobacteria bacterium]|nr:DnaJ domain-containing protein [Gammaproteobacteria bacterium]
MKTYYQILGIEKSASRAEIKTAYRQLASKYHPDRYAANTKFAEDMMKDINVAYQVLYDTEKKIAYDEWLTEERSSSTNKSARGSSSSKSSSRNTSSGRPASKKSKDMFTKENLIKLTALIILNFLFHLIFSKKKRR